MITRFSSRQQKLDQSFLNQRLQNALAYDRIAGYFSSSLLEVAGEAIESINGKIRIVCNSDLDERDVATAKAAEMAMRQEWCLKEPEKLGENSHPRFKRLFDLLVNNKIEVRVLPSHVFGLIHGKAGVISLTDGKKTSFMGSANETFSGWRMNYELVWEDTSQEAIDWVQYEFDFLWNHKDACKLSEAVIADIGRIAHRVEIDLPTWRKSAEPEKAVIESPVYRKEAGLWAHQKYFVKKAFEAHKKYGARFVLADQVGLGKTIQLAMAAQLMALYGDKPILVLAPKTLLWQWQDELKTLLDMPSAVWNGKQWIDENEIEYPANGIQNLTNCPRRVGIISQGLITSGGEAATILKTREYECVIVDEAHRARRRKMDLKSELDPNNLMRFILGISPRTRSLLLATATPVQIHPVEAHDLLRMLSLRDEQVLGNAWSRWQNEKRSLEVVIEGENTPNEESERWEWIRNPFPPEDNDEIFFEQVRNKLTLREDQFVINGDRIQELSLALTRKIRDNSLDFFSKHNPFIRHIIRRTRAYLENTIDPETNEAFLKPVRVELFGEDDSDALTLPGYLKNAYETAEEFCKKINDRMQGAGFLKTLLLRRLGSSIEAGRVTADKMLNSWATIDASEEDEENEEKAGTQNLSKSLTEEEMLLLKKLIQELQANQERDPKFEALSNFLLKKNWLELGCIVFSQYFVTIWWVANQLTEDLPNEKIAVYAGGTKSGIFLNKEFKRVSKEEIKTMIKHGEIRLVLGTDAASEGLNLQRLGTLINLDLPWNPTKLEQRKGRIQRIGQIRDTVYVYNMRYRGSVEDRVHQMLSQRLENIMNLFGQIPDILEDAWVEAALGDIDKAKELIDSVPERHPFEMKYDKIEKVDWESCSVVLNEHEKKIQLSKGW